MRIQNSLSTTVTILFLAVAVFAGAACHSFKNWVSDRTTGTEAAIVRVPNNDDGEDEYLVLSSTNDDSELGVKEMRLGYWKEAVEHLKRAVVADLEDERSRFALGVAYEMSGDLEGALNHYEAAARLPSDVNENYLASVERVREKMD